MQKQLTEILITLPLFSSYLKSQLKRPLSFHFPNVIWKQTNFILCGFCCYYIRFLFLFTIFHLSCLWAVYRIGPLFFSNSPRWGLMALHPLYVQHWKSFQCVYAFLYSLYPMLSSWTYFIEIAVEKSMGIFLFFL